MTTISQKIKECELLLKEIEEKWEYQDSIGYLRDSYDAALYLHTLEKIERFKWLEAGQTGTQPPDNDLFNWAQKNKVNMPQQPNPNQGYLKIGLVDIQQLRKDYWEYYKLNPDYK